MGSLRTPGTGETVKSHSQGGESVQEIGEMVWNNTEFEKVLNARQAHEQTVGVIASGSLAWNYDEAHWLMNPTASHDGTTAGIVPMQAPGLRNSSGTLDIQRNNTTEEVALASEARTAEAAASGLINYNHTKLLVRLSVTVAGTGTLRLNVNASSGIIASFAPFTPIAPSSTYFMVGPGLLNVAAATSFPAEKEAPLLRTASVNAFIPRTFGFTITPSGSSSWTYSVLYALVV